MSALSFAIFSSRSLIFAFCVVLTKNTPASTAVSAAIDRKIAIASIVVKRVPCL